MTKILEQSTPYTHPFGDTDVYGDYAQYIRGFSTQEVEDKNFLLLMYINPISTISLKILDYSDLDMDSLDMADVTNLLNKSKYTCPYSNRQYFALHPIAIFSDDVEKYFKPFTNKPHYFDAAVDKKWNLKHHPLHHFESPEKVMTKFDDLMMGAGYTDFTNIHDGSCSRCPVVVELSNGDLLYCVTLVWHNK